MAISIKQASKSCSSIAFCFYIKATSFHSTPALERRRRTNWECGGHASRGSSKKNYNYSRRNRKMNSKHSLLRNFNDYAEYLFQGFRADDDFSDPSSSKGPSWFKGQDWAKGKRRNNSASQDPQRGNYRNGGFQFCFGDDDDVEVIFRSAFGGERSSYWSFINDDSDQWRNSSYTNNNKRSWKWKNRYESDYDTYEDDNDESESNLASHRLALGLSASGPLKLEEVKNAYRACALKWHPDRHQGSSKVAAEEKFKACSSAYQSLCDKLDYTYLQPS